jgi:hypothetical protein
VNISVELTARASSSSFSSSQLAKRAATMDNADHVALPKGIVVNTSTIYQEVANFPQVPPDQVWKYWRGMLGPPVCSALPLLNLFTNYNFVFKCIQLQTKNFKILSLGGSRTFGGMYWGVIDVS